jgi:hypothetical protein
MDKLLADAKRSAFMIPQFQREFVWTIGQVKLLVDSIARNYPIGSLLLLAETDPSDPLLKSRRVQATLQGDDPQSGQPIEPQPNQFYVLDGQQRLTSIVRVTSSTYWTVSNGSRRSSASSSRHPRTKSSTSTSGGLGTSTTRRRGRTGS